jgi:predicted nucleic acid-binding protein
MGDARLTVTRIYLDTCSLQRPLDSKTQVRITLEAEAVLGVLAFCASGEAELISSDALMFEIGRNPNIARREYAAEALSAAKVFVELTDRLEKLARELHEKGIRPLDALHLASAQEGQADYFCTCDDRLLSKAQAVGSVKVKVVSPIELIEEIERW